MNPTQARGRQCKNPVFTGELCAKSHKVVIMMSRGGPCWCPCRRCLRAHLLRPSWPRRSERRPARRLRRPRAARALRLRSRSQIHLRTAVVCADDAQLARGCEAARAALSGCGAAQRRLLENFSRLQAGPAAFSMGGEPASSFHGKTKVVQFFEIGPENQVYYVYYDSISTY